jgi:hypothetical protein
LYNGETFIAQEELNTFLETAQELQIKGLQRTQENESDQNEGSDSKPIVRPRFSEMESFHKTVSDSFEEIADSVDGDIALVQTEEDDTIVFNTNLELDLHIEQMMEKSENLWQCKKCGKTAKHKTNLKSHVETHIEGVTHICHICNKTFSTRVSLRMHITDFHSQLTFNCQNCGKMGMNKTTFKNHKRTCKY